jgi:hypothetical protein
VAISIKHPPVAGPNDPSKQVSKTVYEQEHDVSGFGSAAEAATTDFDAAGSADAAYAAAATDLATHEGAADPHTGYQKESEKNAASGYAGLSAGTKLDGAQQNYGSSANTACEGNDARLSDQRAPTDGDKGDITVSSSGATWTIDNGAVTLAKMENRATQRVIGRNTAGTGTPEEVTLSQALDWVGSAADGDILIRSGGAWTRLAKGTAGQKLHMNSGATALEYFADWQVLAESTLGTNSTRLLSGPIPARSVLRVLGYIEGYGGSDTASLQFNSSTAAYRYRWLTSAAGTSTFSAGLVSTSANGVKIGSANTTAQRLFDCTITNDASVTEKLVGFNTHVFGTGSATTQATITLGNGAWISPASTQVSSVHLFSTSNMLAGTKMLILGSPT